MTDVTNADAIMVASLIENVNIRGRIIEFLITADEDKRDRMKKILKDEVIHLPEFTTKDDLGDYERTFDNGHTYTDIKTKIICLDSAPKAYNIDKFLEKMAESDSSFFFYFIGIGEDGVFNTALCSVYHNDLIDASIVQHHWAGRSTRGVIQFAGKTLNKILLCEKFRMLLMKIKLRTIWNIIKPIIQRPKFLWAAVLHQTSCFYCYFRGETALGRASADSLALWRLTSAKVKYGARLLSSAGSLNHLARSITLLYVGRAATEEI